jgi:sec-independent protein translocase protein TatB
MFDISWTEFLLIGVVALIVIGPKELPAVMRTMGQWTRKVRSMAADFQNQFQEAMREAEMADLKKQVDDIAHDIKHYDPLKDVRADVEAVGKEIENTVAHPPATELPIADAGAGLGNKNVVDTGAKPIVPGSAEKSSIEPHSSAATAEPRDKDVVAAASGRVTPQSAETAAQPESTRRTG